MQQETIELLLNKESNIMANNTITMEYSVLVHLDESSRRHTLNNVVEYQDMEREAGWPNPKVNFIFEDGLNMAFACDIIQTIERTK